MCRRPNSEPSGDKPVTEARATMLQRFGYWGTVGAWMALISWFSTDAFSASNTSRYIDPVLRFLFPHLSNANFLFAHFLIRKSAHFSEFFVFGLLIFWASRRGRASRWRLRWMLQALALGGGYALLDELHQLFVPSRTASLTDSGIDCLGATCSQILLYLRYRWRRARS